MRTVKRNTSCLVTSRYPKKYIKQRSNVNSIQNIHLINKPKILKSSYREIININNKIKKPFIKINKKNIRNPPLTRNYSSNSFIYDNEGNFDTFQYSLKEKKNLSKCQNYNCDNYQYFYNFYLNNPLSNTLQENSIEKLAKF